MVKAFPQYTDFFPLNIHHVRGTLGDTGATLDEPLVVHMCRCLKVPVNTSDGLEPGWKKDKVALHLGQLYKACI